MLASLVARPPIGPEWSWDIKWDGYRIAVHREPDRLRIIARRCHDWTHRFPGIEAAALATGPATLIGSAMENRAPKGAALPY